jgi:leader peptidase (prepilin peptidase)/N-methyltransferase
MSWLISLQQSPPLYYGFLALFGAIAGSFASAAIWRIPREGMSISKPARSHCPKCGAMIRWHDNLPLVGWLVLGGKCRDCKVSFGPGYVAHEAILSGLFVLVGRSWVVDPALGGGEAALILTLVAMTSLWIAAAIDWQHFILPDGITIGGVGFGLLASALVPAFHIWPEMGDRLPWGVEWFGLTLEDPAVKLALMSSVLGATISFGFLLGIGKLFSYILGQDALGFGDVKYLAAVGALLGLEGALWTLLVGVFAGALFGIANVSRMILAVRRRRRTQGVRKYAHSAAHVGWSIGRVIPFGPPLILGTTLILLDPASVHQFFFETWPHLLNR